MIYCQRCVLPDTRPGTKFVNGVCQACLNSESNTKVNWQERFEELEDLVKPFRRSSKYDCMIAVSGGKDSHYLCYLFKVVLGMNPLLLRVGDCFGITEVGKYNIKNLSNTFELDMLEYNVNYPTYRNMSKFCFEYYGNFPFVDGTVYTIPYNLAVALNIPLLIYGENPAYVYGSTDKDSPDATPHIINNFKEMEKLFDTSGISMPEIMLTRDLSLDVKSIFVSYYVPWNGQYNYEVAKMYGFKDLTHEWDRQGNIENYDSVDMIGWQVSHWLKYIKFGFGRTTDIASRWVREGTLTREWAVELVKARDSKLDQRMLEDFCQSVGYSIPYFYEVCDKFYNQEIFEKKNGLWVRRPECQVK